MQKLHEICLITMLQKMLGRILIKRGDNEINLLGYFVLDRCVSPKPRNRCQVCLKLLLLRLAFF